MELTYLDILPEKFPGISARCTIYPVTYENIEWIGEGPFPTQEQLDAEILIARRERAWKEIQAFRDARIQNGGYQVNGKWFHSDNISRIQQIGLIMMGANMPPNLMWKSMDGTFVHMTPLLAQQIFAAAGQSDMANHATAEQHRQQVFASSEPENYNFMAANPAWPPIFGE